MSFTVILQENRSPDNKVDKDVAEMASVQGVLRKGTSIIQPIILIEDTVPETLLSSVNYATINEFNRKYFVTDIKTTINGLWEIHMSVDVLASFADQIREQTAIVARQAETYNLYLDDGWFMAYQNPLIQTKFFSNATPFESQEFVLVVAGNAQSAS